MSDKYKPGIGFAAGSWMLKWNLMDSNVHNNQIKFDNNEEIDVFINFESVLRNLSIQRGMANNIAYHKKEIVIEMESSIINLMANYKAYFNKERCIPKLYFYYTDLLATEDQQMKVYNKYYREYYFNRYKTNPQFRAMGDTLTSIIIPEVELILSYIPNCYFLKSKSFDSWVIPLIVTAQSGRRGVIISGDIFDTLYLFNPNFMTIYIKRRYQNFEVCSTIDSALQSIIKDQSPFDLTIFNSELYYRLLLAIKGSKIRNIRSAKYFGYGKFINILQRGVKDGIVLKDFSSLESIIELFPLKYREDLKQAFICTSLETQYDLLNKTDSEYIQSQIVDKVDVESVEALNNQRFRDMPINLQMLL